MINKVLLCGTLALLSINPLFADGNVVPAAIVKTGISDAVISAKIKALYQQSSLLKNAQIIVETKNQHVLLMGTVDTNAEYEQAVALAHSVSNVIDVNVNNLRVAEHSAPFLTDADITVKVKTALMQAQLFSDKPVGYWPIHIQTKDGIVYLSGVVDTQQQRNNIIRLTRGVIGVKSVISAISVK